MFYFDPMYLIFMIPGVILMLWSQARIKGSYSKYSKIRNDENLTGAQVARRILDANGLQSVPITQSPGELSDHYDPRDRSLHLSPAVYGQPSIAAMGIAAHEVGHALQHQAAYTPMKLRTAIVPAVNIGSNLGIFVLMLGVMLANQTMAWWGVALFALTTVFALLTLPVEFDASRRAMQQLQRLGIADGGVGGGPELAGVKNVLTSAAWTYVASFASSLLTLLYYVSMVGRSSND